MFHSLRFKSKSELAQEMGISRETLRKKLKEIEGLETGRRQLLYPREVKRIYQEFGSYL
ncbi:MAG: helix-turn-helix domain-containing protein [Bacteroidota bacterium]